MKQRVLVAVFGIPLILAVVVFAPDWATAVGIAGLCVIASHELLNAVSGADKAKRWFGLAGAMAVFTVFTIYCGADRFAGTVLPTLAVFFQAAMVVLVFVCAVVEYGGEHQLTFTDICTILVAGIAIPMALGALLQLRMLPYGGGMVLIPMVAAFCSRSSLNCSSSFMLVPSRFRFGVCSVSHRRYSAAFVNSRSPSTAPRRRSSVAEDRSCRKTASRM